MPTDNEKSDSDSELQKPILESNPLGVGSDAASNQKINKKPKASVRTKADKQPIIINIFESENEAKEAKRANDISTAAIIVNSVLILLTAFIAVAAIWQSKSAEKTATLADSTFRADTAYNNKNIRTQAAATIKSNKDNILKKIREDSIFNLQKNGLDAQIASLKQTNEIFKKENEPILQFKTAIFFNMKDGESVKVLYYINNFSKRAISIINTTTSYKFIKYKVDSIKFVNNPFNENQKKYQAKVEAYVSTTEPLNTIFVGEDLSSIDKKEFEESKSSFYLAVKIGYINFITNKKNSYFFIIRCVRIGNGDDGKPKMIVVPIKSENISK